MAVPILLSLIVAACGKRGDPLPPLRLEPGRIPELTANRVDERIELRFTVPAANADGSRPPVAERVEIYRMSSPADAAAPPVPQILQPDLLRARYVIRSDEVKPPAAAPAPDDRRAAPGETVTFVDGIDPAVKPGTPEAPTWRYVAVAVTSRNRRGPPSPVVSVPLSQVVPPGPTPSVTFDEKSMTISWTATDEPAGRVFRVYQVESVAKAAVGKLLSDPKLDKPEFTTAVEFGSERCFVVRIAVPLEHATIEGPPGAAACVTPVDRFPPPPPVDLVAVPDQGAVNLVWPAVDAKDLLGYLILRGDGAGDTLQPLVKEPVTGTSYRDTAVTSGSTYTYALVAVDRSGNQSGRSNPQTVVVR